MSDTEHPQLPPIVPHLGKRGHIPKVGEKLTVRIPGEECQSVVVEVFHGGDSIMVELLGVVMGKSNNYRKGDLVGCRRDIAPLLNTEMWTAQSQRALDAAAEAEYFARSERRRIEEEQEATRRVVAEAKLPPRAPPPVEPAAKRAVLGPRRNRVRA